MGKAGAIKIVFTHVHNLCFRLQPAKCGRVKNTSAVALPWITRVTRATWGIIRTALLPNVRHGKAPRDETYVSLCVNTVFIKVPGSLNNGVHFHPMHAQCTQHV